MDTTYPADAPSEVVGAPQLVPGGLPSPGPHETIQGRVPASAVAAGLAALAEKVGAGGICFLARSEAQAEEVAQSFKALVPAAETILLPPWDCLPYDRVAPSRESMGRRASALHALARPAEGMRLIVSSPEAVLQRVFRAKEIATGFTELAVGDALDLKAFEARLQACGYILDDRVDEPGEAALLGRVVDVFPPDAAQPARLLLDDENKVAGIRFYDPATQRTEEPVAAIRLGPASELPPVSPQGGNALREGMEERMVAAGKSLVPVFDLMGEARIVLGEGLDERVSAALDLIDVARRARDEQKGRTASRELFYLDRDQWKKTLKGRVVELDLRDKKPVPQFATAADPTGAAGDFVRDRLAAGFRVLLAAPGSELDRLSRAMARRLKRKPDAVAGWDVVLTVEGGSLLQARLDLDRGFVDAAARVAVVTSSDIHGTRLCGSAARSAPSLATEPELRIGDVVLHEDHGIAVLGALESVEAGGITQDVVRLEFHGGATLLAPVEEFGRIWRYGADEEAVTLDRLKGDGWAKRRTQVSAEIEEAARQLVALAAEREEAGAAKMEPPRPAYARFAANFPYPETPDQAAAVEAVLGDLASGKAMNRLICGDVGFGKTEVALRAAAVAALNGRQVALVAPTTVLARQHFETFSRRFRGTGVAVTLLSRVVSEADAEKARQGLADGSVGIVVGTQAIAAKGVSFADLGLLVIDEEHRFGVRLKERLRGLAPRLHVLSMSATPIPRTLAGAMVGVQEASLLASPPARRRPVRTELAPFDPVAVKTALIREKRRGGQSFCVVPRIEDIEPTAAELAGLVPDLSVLVAHGGMDAAAMDDAMVRFADGDADILLSTNIIETGLDVPRANTIVICGADRFGMAQLHQLRGRVGRGRAQGSAYLLTEAGKEVAPETRSRLSTLIAFDRLGSGLAISARDLDLRGAGDLVGEEQAGHMRLIGVSLYQHLLAQAVNKARGGKGEAVFEPDLQLETSGSLPAAYVPEAVVRLNLYSRLQRFAERAEIDAFAEEIEDRFGTLPPETATLLDLARLKLAAAAAGISKVSAGPAAIAVEFRQPKAAPWEQLGKLEHCMRSEDRLICRKATVQGTERLAAARHLIDGIRSVMPAGSCCPSGDETASKLQGRRHDMKPAQGGRPQGRAEK